jgi:hypothetical protein
MKYNVGDVNSTEKGSAARANGGKVEITQIPLHILGGVAKVLMYGKRKYASYNWAKGTPWSVPMDCCFRHLIAFWYLKEECDTESKLHHLDHAITNLMFLRHHVLSYREGDDRPPAWTSFQNQGELIKTLFQPEAEQVQPRIETTIWPPKLKKDIQYNSTDE